MNKKSKKIILTIVLVAVLGILAKPYFFPNEKAFAVTPKPYQAFKQAMENGQPVFLEFYASW